MTMFIGDLVFWIILMAAALFGASLTFGLWDRLLDAGDPPSELQVAQQLGYTRRTRIDQIAPSSSSLSNDARASAVEALGARGNERMFSEQPISQPYTRP